MIDVFPFAGYPIAVFGLGLSGLSAAKALVKSEADVSAWDDDEDACEDAEDGAFQMQTRLDAQLQASGFSSSDRALSRDLELYYFQSG